MGIYLFLFAVNIALTFLLFLLHFRFTRKDFPANRMLSLVLFCLFYLSAMLTLFYMKWILYVPHLYRTGNIFIYLIFPASYLYTRKILLQEGYQWKDLLHALPSFLYILDFLPFFMLDGSVKVSMLNEDYSRRALYSFRQSWLFPENFHFYFRVFLAAIYLYRMGRLWYSHFGPDGSPVFRKENRSLMQWLAALIILLTAEMFPSAIVKLFNLDINIITFSNLLSYGVTVCFALFLLFKPEILYGVKGLWVMPLAPSESQGGQVQDMASDAAEQEGEEKSRKVYLKQELVDQVKKAIEETLLQEKKFLNKGYSMFDLANDTGYSTHQLSAFINNHLGMNFKEYLNSLRVQYLLEQIRENKELERYTLEALADMVGFSNRYSFLNAFKRVTGETPSVLLKRRRTSE